MNGKEVDKNDTRSVLPSEGREALAQEAIGKTLSALGVTVPSDPDATIRAASPAFVSDSGATILTGRQPKKEELPALGEGFEILGPIGEGGMGLVFRARQHGLEREVAIKTMRKELGRHPQLQEDFVAEAIVTGILDHPNIVPVHSISESQDGQVYFAMKLVGGKSWSDLLHPKAEEDTLSLGRHLEILRAVANAVAFAHSKGTLHRDLKPDNVMVGEFGEVLVMDWGLACRFGETPRTLSLGMSKRSRHASSVSGAEGTPSYLAPEMAMGLGHLFGPWTDVYLLGAILHEILNGEAPHKGDTVKDVVLNATRPQPPSFENTVPSGLQEICRKAMANEIGDRFQDAKELIEALRRFDLHSESESIATAARTEVIAGQEASEPKQIYAAYQRAIAGFGQAIAIWPANEAAKDDLESAHRELATAALGQGDLGLARSHIDSIEDGDLAKRIDEAETVQSQIKRTAARQRQVVVGAAALVIAILSIGFVLVLREKNRVTEAKQRADRESAAKSVALNDFERMSDIKRLSLALEEAELLWPPLPDLVPVLESWQETHGPLFLRLTVHEETIKRLAKSAVVIDGRQEFGEDISTAFMHQSLVQLAKGLRRELEPEGVVASIKKRLELSRKIGVETVAAYSMEWNQAIAAVKADARFNGLELTPQIGLIPLGSDPKSGFQEFAHWLSHTPSHPLPKRAESGRFEVDGKTGMILTLLPGADFIMGSTQERSHAHFDISCQPIESPPHSVVLAPFFLAKYEVTRGQWKRLTDQSDPSHWTTAVTSGWIKTEDQDRHPVETVNWIQCEQLMRRSGLVLPTEARWEYACRAGTSSPWSFGTDPSTFVGFANFADESYAVAFGKGAGVYEQGCTDNFMTTAPVGTFAPNSFGIHDMHGNVWEWCQDQFGDYTRQHGAADGILMEGSDLRTYRGGSFYNPAVIARSSNRQGYAEFSVRYSLGVRATRDVRK
ncbi:MAG: sulfatase activating formylglycine-generating enzyme [Planctomycetota bacterium]|jgi:formylglycine-generating enzyme required for sulfatase activity/tRNA A-37 threonylcarbamoyl transferase component Bud32